jgi:hypothetical protein
MTRPVQYAAEARLNRKIDADILRAMRDAEERDLSKAVIEDDIRLRKLRLAESMDELETDRSAE